MFRFDHAARPFFRKYGDLKLKLILVLILEVLVFEVLAFKVLVIL